jgi:hypothetical protein
MWLLFIALPLFVLLLVAGLVAGGIYAAVLVPIAVVIGGGAAVYTMWGRSTHPSNIPSERDHVKPLPHSDHSNVAATPSTPDQLVDARRHQQ